MLWPEETAVSIRNALLLPTFATLLVAIGCASSIPESAPAPGRTLHPEVEPYESGMLRVSERHELYWELCGNPDGLPVIVLHGGPGGSAGPRSRRYFDPSRFKVLLFDQRGAGRSLPAAEWRDNTTQALVADIVRLREHVGIDEPALVFGGSWGSTLALAYAEAHPEQVAGLVLRGVFLGERAEIDHFYHGGAAGHFPDAWERLRSVLPHPERFDYPRQLFEMTQSDDPALRQRAIEEWARYEIRLVSVGMTDARADAILGTFDATAFSVLENHYMAHGCFLEEGQLLRDAERIAHIPTFIAHGRFDVICQPRQAWRLAQALDVCELRLVANAGHTAYEPPLTEALLEGIDWVVGRIAAR